MTDSELLAAVLERDDLTDKVKGIFEDMAFHHGRSGHPLSQRQRAWAEATLKGEPYESEPEYSNWSGTPRGREVESMVRDKPLKPPTRRER